MCPSSGRVGPAHPPTALRRALVLVQAAPGAVLLWPADRVGEALRPHRAGVANGLGLALPDLSLRLPLPVWPEEEHNVATPAASLILPAPVRPWHQRGLTAYLRHESLS